MKPGRELDLLVAEKVMDENWWAIKQSEWTPLLIDLLVDLKPYSTDIGAAWEIVEKMKEEGEYAEYIWIDYSRTSATEDAPPFWECNFNHCVAQSTKSAPHAICLAALKCKGVGI